MVRYATRRTPKYGAGAVKGYRYKRATTTKRYTKPRTTMRAPAVPSYGRRNYAPVRQVTSVVPTTTITRMPRVEVKQAKFEAGPELRTLANVNSYPRNIVYAGTSADCVAAIAGELARLTPHINTKAAGPLTGDQEYVYDISEIDQGPAVHERVGNSIICHTISVQVQINSFGRGMPLDMNGGVATRDNAVVLSALHNLHVGAIPVTWTLALFVQNQVPTDFERPTLTDLWAAMFETPSAGGSVEEHLFGAIERYRAKAFGTLVFRKDIVCDGSKSIRKTFNIRKKIELKYSGTDGIHGTENRLLWVQFPSANIATGGTLFTTPYGVDAANGWVSQAITPLTQCHSTVRTYFTDA